MADSEPIPAKHPVAEYRASVSKLGAALVIGLTVGCGSAVFGDWFGSGSVSSDLVLGVGVADDEKRTACCADCGDQKRACSRLAESRGQRCRVVHGTEKKRCRCSVEEDLGFAPTAFRSKTRQPRRIPCTPIIVARGVRVLENASPRVHPGARMYGKFYYLMVSTRAEI